MTTNSAAKDDLYLTQFTKAYIDAIIALSDPEDEEEMELINFAYATMMQIRSDCAQFIELAGKSLKAAHAAMPSYTASNAGHDFWLTRNGHGAGFWDRDLGDVGDALTKVADTFSNIDAYMGDDGKVYLA